MNPSWLESSMTTQLDMTKKESTEEATKLLYSTLEDKSFGLCFSSTTFCVCFFL